MDQITRLRELLIEQSLEIGDFVLASGAHSRYYFDARRTTFSAEGQYLVGVEGLRALRDADLDPSWVGGLTMGADPIACAIAHRSWLEGKPVRAFSVRKAPKDHGTARRVEGGLPPGAPVVVIEDTLTSGASALMAIEALEAHGASILGVLALVDREAGGTERIREAGYPLVRLFTATELLAAAGVEPVSPRAEGA